MIDNNNGTQPNAQGALDALLALNEKEPAKKNDAKTFIADNIKLFNSLIDKGHPLTAINEVLAANGYKISVHTLRKHIGNIAPKKKTATKKKTVATKPVTTTSTNETHTENQASQFVNNESN